MDKPIIEVRNIGKKYDINHMRGGYIALRDVLSNIFKSPFSFLKNKAQEAVGIKRREEFWALKNVSFNIGRGEVVGIIGANGAGKSTLLKILSQITPPTEGEIVLRGRVGSLLEVGTGFHPELSGRENIFLNGAILGMKKSEIEKKFDQIVEFAGIGKFLDTPVKHYSSGMYVRLAFSVAAHMEPDILLVDEVLAVGDAEFQKKCLGKMNEITKNEGRTILFVSHNLGAVKQLCDRVIVLKNGKVYFDGDTNTATEKYLTEDTTTPTPLDKRVDRRGDGRIKFTKIEILPYHNKPVKTGMPFDIRLYFQTNEQLLENLAVSITINDYSGHLLAFWTETSGSNFDIKDGKGYIDCKIDYCPLMEGSYFINVYSTSNDSLADFVTNAAILKVDDTDYFSKGRRDHEAHPRYVVNHAWSIKYDE